MEKYFIKLVFKFRVFKLKIKGFMEQTESFEFQNFKIVKDQNLLKLYLHIHFILSNDV